MHDCFGKPLKPFDRVRAATTDELRANGHTDTAMTLSPAEQVVVSGNTGTSTCNINLSPSVGMPIPMIGPSGNGMAMFAFESFSYMTARTLVKLES